MNETIKISFKPFKEMDTIKEPKEQRLIFQEFLSGLTPDSVELLKSKGFDPTDLPNQSNLQNQQSAVKIQRRSFFQEMFYQLNLSDKRTRFANDYLEFITLKKLFPKIDEVGFVVRITKLDNDAGWTFNICPNDNGSPFDKSYGTECKDKSLAPPQPKAEPLKKLGHRRN